MRKKSTGADIPWSAVLMEGGGVALFVIAAVAVTAVIEHPESPIRALLGSPLLRRFATGAGMALTAAALIYSPWGRRSGAHLNPSVTLTYFRLRKVPARLAAAYIAAQFIGAAAAIVACAVLLRGIADVQPVNFVATVPGLAGVGAAFLAELAISFGMMTAILSISNTERLARFTGAAAACLIAFYITVEAPLSGMSMNPARSLAPAIAANALQFVWIYFSAPPLGMLLAAELFVRRHGHAAVRCAKLHHPSTGSCHFHCTP